MTLIEILEARQNEYRAIAAKSSERDLHFEADDKADAYKEAIALVKKFVEENTYINEDSFMESANVHRHKLMAIPDAKPEDPCTGMCDRCECPNG